MNALPKKFDIKMCPKQHWVATESLRLAHKSWANCFPCWKSDQVTSFWHELFRVRSSVNLSKLFSASFVMLLEENVARRLNEEKYPYQNCVFAFWFLKILITSQEENSFCKFGALQVIKVVRTRAYSRTGTGNKKRTTPRKVTERVSISK